MRIRRLAVVVAALGIAGVVGTRMLADGRVRDAIKTSPVLRRLNSRWLRRVDARIFNARHGAPTPAALGDGHPAEEIVLGDPMGLARSPTGVLYVADRGGTGPGHVIWAIEGGRARIIAGTGGRGVEGTGRPALSSALGSPQGIALDGAGRLYVADSYNHVVLRIDPDGRLVRVAGIGRPGDEGDGGPADEAALNQPYDVRVALDGAIYIADYGNNRIRRVTPDGRIATVAGTGEPGYDGDGGPAAAARLNGPYGVYPDSRHGFLIADSQNHVLRRVDATGLIETIAGTGRPGNTGDEGPARQAAFDTPQGIVVDEAGSIFVDDEHNHEIRVIDTAGVVHRLLGTGKPGFSADGTPADSTALNDPENMVLLPDGRLLLTEAGNGRVRMLGADHRLVTIAGGAR